MRRIPIDRDKDMLVGFSAYSLRFSAGIWIKSVKEPMDVWNFIEIAREIGADGIMLDPVFFPDFTKSTIELILDRIREENLYIELEACGAEPCYIKKMIDVSSELDSSVLRIFIGGVNSRHELGLERWHRRLDMASRQLREIASYAQEKEVRVAIENHGDVTISELLKVLEEVNSEWIGVCYDTGNQIFVLEDPLEAAERIAPYVFTMHIKEYKLYLCPKGVIVEGCKLFDGDIPNRKIVEILRKNSPIREKLHLNIEVPLERIVVPFLDLKFTENIGRVDGTQLLRILRYTRGKWSEKLSDFESSTDMLRQEYENLEISIMRAKEVWGWI